MGFWKKRKHDYQQDYANACWEEIEKPHGIAKSKKQKNAKKLPSKKSKYRWVWFVFWAVYFYPLLKYMKVVMSMEFLPLKLVFIASYLFVGIIGILFVRAITK